MYTKFFEYVLCKIDEKAMNELLLIRRNRDENEQIQNNRIK